MSKAYTLLKPRKSEKTDAMVKVILKAMDDGDLLTVYDIAFRIDKKFSPKRGTLKNQLDALVNYGILKKEVYERRVYYKPTTEAYVQFRGY